jgi:hypothetical protein
LDVSCPFEAVAKPTNDLIIEVYICVSDFLKQRGHLRTRGFLPKLLDAEVITMEVVGEILGFGSDKAIHNNPVVSHGVDIKCGGPSVGALILCCGLRSVML